MWCFCEVTPSVHACIPCSFSGNMMDETTFLSSYDIMKMSRRETDDSDKMRYADQKKAI